MTNTTTKKGAVKGTVAAAAGIAVLLGGAGTFALWNTSGAIGGAASETGTLTADFSGTTDWQDVTPGAANAITDITTFHMVPGDVIEGTTTLTVTATGENLVVAATLDDTQATLPDDVTATITLTDAAHSDSGESLALTGSDAGTTYDLTAVVSLAFDQSAEASKSAAINLQDVKIDLQQVLSS
ncbi:alternate-type signal peptide domain-containing protein [Isoptericola sp. NPDC019693]|uniref:alternate-type signal peptide domain-containing protein n=1 Tax=Isoptericola sp. NPDC019693 TaxID=3364009 RepID=UPI00379FA865